MSVIPEIMTVAEAAALCNVKPSMVDHWIDDHGLHSARTGEGGSRMIRADDLASWLSSVSLPLPGGLTVPSPVVITGDMMHAVYDPRGCVAVVAVKSGQGPLVGDDADAAWRVLGAANGRSVRITIEVI
jgi:excisionase family DNA binding protein